MDYITLLGCIGVIACAYAINVEMNMKKNKKYVAFCDVGQSMSCSRVLVSEYSKMGKLLFNLDPDHPLNVPNTYYGFLFYCAVILYNVYPFTLIPCRQYLLLFASIISNMSSVCLAYILYFKLKTACLVCVATYIINAFLLYFAYQEVKLFLN
jgi:vitamin-K-epoxide reductase (warfarin-sensitive)